MNNLKALKKEERKLRHKEEFDAYLFGFKGTKLIMERFSLKLIVTLLMGFGLYFLFNNLLFLFIPSIFIAFIITNHIILSRKNIYCILDSPRLEILSIMALITLMAIIIFVFLSVCMFFPISITISVIGIILLSLTVFSFKKSKDNYLFFKNKVKLKKENFEDNDFLYLKDIDKLNYLISLSNKYRLYRVGQELRNIRINYLKEKGFSSLNDYIIHLNTIDEDVFLENE